MLGWAEEKVVGALEAACAAELLADRGEAYQFVHDLIREVVLGDLSSARRRLLHRRAGRALEQLPAHVRRHPAELAQQFLEGREAHQALPYLLHAGEQAEAAQAWAEAERDLLEDVRRWRGRDSSPSWTASGSTRRR
jgi:predicted ATPase